MIAEQKRWDIHELDVYSYEADVFFDEELDDDEINLEEEAFLEGYEEALSSF
ncbi:hypothetical protein J4410_01610 [Candidatus Woesearchaeota archaeon]|nr:hypothetical protein [Candidatus Woesearchaeota archaeon]